MSDTKIIPKSETTPELEKIPELDKITPGIIIESSIKKIKKMDRTTLAINIYISTIVILYILYGFILTNCIYDKFIILKNIVLNITLFPTPTPTQLECIPR